MDVAVIDFVLADGESVPVQDALERKVCPFVVLTAYPPVMVRRNPSQQVLSKPVERTSSVRRCELFVINAELSRALHAHNSCEPFAERRRCVCVWLRSYVRSIPMFRTLCAIVASMVLAAAPVLAQQDQQQSRLLR